jgi:hypothetical protein
MLTIAVLLVCGLRSREAPCSENANQQHEKLGYTRKLVAAEDFLAVIEFKRGWIDAGLASNLFNEPTLKRDERHWSKGCRPLAIVRRIGSKIC